MKASGHGSYLGYIIGYALSLLLTIAAYLTVTHRGSTAGSIAVIILSLAIIQLLVQLLFFLHLNKAWKSPWNIVMLLFMVLVVSIVAFGSLWIMSNLNYSMPSTSSPKRNIDQYIQNDEGIKKGY